jgi:hypothetical protein
LIAGLRFAIEDLAAGLRKDLEPAVGDIAISHPESLRSTFGRGLAMNILGSMAGAETSMNRSYELEKILFRVPGSLRFPLRVRIPLVRNANA